MTLGERFKGAVIAIGLLLGCFPLAVALTIMTAPIWSAIETRFGVEAYGHSGPAEWCYLVVYAALVSFSTVVWARSRRRKRV